MEKCVICLDESPSVWKVDQKECMCIVFVHSDCFNRWRVRQNCCIICHGPLPMIPFHIRMYYCSYTGFTTYSMILKMLYLGVYIFFIYNFMIFSADLFFFSFLSSFDDL